MENDYHNNTMILQVKGMLDLAEDSEDEADGWQKLMSKLIKLVMILPF